MIRKFPKALTSLVEEHDPNVICLQETKLLKWDLNDPRNHPMFKKTLIYKELLGELGYDAYYCAPTGTKRRGFVSTAVLVRRPTWEQNRHRFRVPTGITPRMGHEVHDKEGRLVAVDFPLFSLVNVYVPNVGQKLQHLDYRVKDWDVDLVEFIKNKRLSSSTQQQTTTTTTKPMICLGNFNAAHTDLDVWNPDDRKLSIRCRTSAEERESFSKRLLDEANLVDCFRRLHPTAVGHYTYWSKTARNRRHNKGLRIDYFLGDPSLFSEEDSKVLVRDCYMLPDHCPHASDHCPLMLELEIKGIKYWDELRDSQIPSSNA